MANLKKKTTHVFKLFQKHRQHPPSKKGRTVDSAEGFENETDSQGILHDTSPPSPLKPNNVTPSGKRNKIRRYFGIGKKSNRKNKNDDVHNDTFMTAETEETNEDNDTKQPILDLFADLRVIHCTTSGPCAPGPHPKINGFDSGLLGSWKDLVLEGDDTEVIEEGIEASVVPQDSDCTDGDHIRSRARSRSLPKPVNVKTGDEEEDFGLPLPPSTAKSNDFGGTEERFFHSFPSFEVTTEIPGFLSPDQESRLGTPARAARRSKTTLDANPAARLLQSLASNNAENPTEFPSASGSARAHDLVITRNGSEVSTLDGSPFAHAENEDDEGYHYAKFDDAGESFEQEDFKSPMEPSIEASPAFASHSIANGFQAEPVGVASDEPSEKLYSEFMIAHREGSASLQLAKLLLMAPPPPPPPLPPTSLKLRRASSHAESGNTNAEYQYRDTALFTSSVCTQGENSQVSAEASAKTENDFLHHAIKGFSPHSWSVIKSGIHSRSGVDTYRESQDSCSGERFETPEQQSDFSITDEVHERSYEANIARNESQPSIDDAEGNASFDVEPPSFEASIPSSHAKSSAAEELLQSDEEGEDGKEEPFDVAASNGEHGRNQSTDFKRSQGSSRTRFMKRALFSLSNGASPLDVIPEQSATSDIIIEPLTNNCRKLCTKLIQHASVDQRWGKQCLKVLDQGGSVTDDDSFAGLSVDDAPTLTLVKSESDSIYDYDCSTSDSAAVDAGKPALPARTSHHNHHVAEGRQNLPYENVQIDDPGVSHLEGSANGIPGDLQPCPRLKDKPIDDGEAEYEETGADDGSGGIAPNVDAVVEEIKSQPPTVPRLKVAHKDDGTMEPGSNWDLKSREDHALSDADEESRGTFTSSYIGRNHRITNRGKKSKYHRREKGNTAEWNPGNAKIPGLSFLNIEALDRFAGNLDCSFFSGQMESDDEIELDFDDESILSYDDESTYKSFDSREFGIKFGIEDEVEDALEWADKHMVFCGNNR